MEDPIRLITAIYSFAFLFSLISLVSMWRIYKKANQPGWAAIVPFYNIIVWLRIISKPSWWLILLFIPLINIIISIWMINLLAKKFERNVGFSVGLIFLSVIFFPLLAFKEYKYSENTESQFHLEDASETIRDKLLIWSLVLACISALFWFLFANFIKDWWNYYYIQYPMNALFLFNFFLVGISVGNKNKTASIILSIVCIIIISMSNIYPLLRDFINNN